MTEKIDFFLASNEIRPQVYPRECRIEKVVLSSERGDYFQIINVSPGIEGIHFGIPEKLFKKLIIAPRHVSDSLFPMSSLPICVYVCVFQNNGNDQMKTISSDDLYVLFIGGIYNKYSDAMMTISKEEVDRYGYI